MQKILKIFILLLIANNAYSQFEKPTANRYYDIKPAPTLKGRVKSITENLTKLYDKDPVLDKLGEYDLITIRRSVKGSKRGYTKTLYNKEGSITAKETYDSTNNLRTQWKYLYDNLNNLIEEDMIFKNGVKRKIETYHYDSLDRWINTFTYDTLGYPNGSETISYNDNTVTILHSYGGKLIHNYESNKTTTENYFANGNISYKSVKTFDGGYTFITAKRYNDKGILLDSTYEKYNFYEHIYEHKFGKQSGVSIEKISYETDTKGDTTLIKTNSYRLNTLNKKGERKVEKIEEFVYDAMGNFIAKTVYYNGKAAYKTIREIEYY